MATRRQEDEASDIVKALDEYVRLAAGIPQVASSVHVPGPERDLFTYIDDRDEAVLDRLNSIEDRLFELFDDVMFDFHVFYLQGRPVEVMAPSTGRVMFSRGNDADAR